MRQLRVTNIQRGCVFDGPGVRTTVFLKGCFLCCPWCCNPEAISFDEQWFVEDSKCLARQGVDSVLCKDCERLGGIRHQTECPFGVAEPVSEDYSIDDLYRIIIKDVSLFSDTGGGVTFSGGEPLLQAKSLQPLLVLLKSSNIGIVFETTLMAPTDNLRLTLPYIDSLLVDLKLQPQMKLDDIAYIEQIKHHLSLVNHKQVAFRMVFVDEIIASRQSVLEILHELGVNKLELLLCHNLGQKKYERLNLPNADFSASRNLADEFTDYMTANEIKTKLLSV